MYVTFAVYEAKYIRLKCKFLHLTCDLKVFVRFNGQAISFPCLTTWLTLRMMRWSGFDILDHWSNTFFFALKVLWRTCCCMCVCIVKLFPIEYLCYKSLTIIFVSSWFFLYVYMNLVMDTDTFKVCTTCFIICNVINLELKEYKFSI